MSCFPFFLRLGLVATLVTGGAHCGWSAVEPDSHTLPVKTESGLTLNKGNPWQTDAPLRKGMENIQRDIREALPRIHAGTQKPKQYSALAKKLHSHVNFITRNCKLTPEADAQLHIVLGGVIQGALALQEIGMQASGAAKVVHALDLYGRHFDHPGWQPVSH
ncbi:MAG: hypothetical protein HQM02_12330 [Magnetococcales bacterium]|nr:hypothetical protein [Magnetococcales bacterium]